VSAWQQFLTTQNLNPGPVDGQFGAGTEHATRVFQETQQLTDDGVVGPDTQRAAVALGFQIPQVNIGSQDQAIDEIGGVLVYQTNDGSAIYFTTGMDVDADGSPHAYKANNGGLDLNKNGKDKSGKWVGVVADAGNNPLVQTQGDPAPGYYISTTSLQDPNLAKTDPHRYVDAEKIPYIVLPGGHLGNATLGDYAIVINLQTGKRVSAIVADSGPKHKIGEASIATAREILGENNSSPRTGGTDEGIRYIVFPGSGENVAFPSSHDDAALVTSLAAIENATAALAGQPGTQTAYV
jgi:peptidoglycan hydrolase-like protein with peptidoglycan-binding domain